MVRLVDKGAKSYVDVGMEKEVTPMYEAAKGGVHWQQTRPGVRLRSEMYIRTRLLIQGADKICK